MQSTYCIVDFLRNHCNQKQMKALLNHQNNSHNPVAKILFTHVWNVEGKIDEIDEYVRNPQKKDEIKTVIQLIYSIAE